MKKKLTILLIYLAFTCNAYAQSESKRESIIQDSEEAKAAFLKTDPDMEKLFKSAYGYVVLPNIGKGGFLVGGAAGRGVAYEKGEKIGFASMSQVTAGLQAGGQAYSEIIFFETEEAFSRFKENKIEFTAQLSAVAIKPGASASSTYMDGVMVFTMSKGGLMYEATLGGQKLKFKKN